MTATGPAEPPGLPPGERTLGGRLREEFDRIREDALRTRDGLTLARLEEIERLARLVQIQNMVHPPSRRRWPVVAALTVTLLLLSLLLFVRVGKTEIELDLVLSQAGFELAQAQVLTEALQLSALGAVGLDALELPRDAIRPERILRENSGERPAAQLEVAAKGSSLTLEPLALPAGTQVLLRPTTLPDQFRLTIVGKDLTLRLGVNGKVRITAAGAPAQTFDYSAPATVVLRTNGKPVDLDLSLPPGKALQFASDLAVKTLALDAVEQHLDPERPLVRRVSSILSGTLYFEALNGREKKLRASERLQLKGVQGSIRSLRTEGHQIQVSFQGQVHDLVAGRGARSVMPTWLEWLQAQHGLSLLWGATFYLFGLLMGALRWWGWKL